MIGIRIGVWNANGISRKQNQLINFLNNNNFDVMLLSEIHFNHNSLIDISNYALHTANSPQAPLCIGGAGIHALSMKLFRDYYCRMCYAPLLVSIQIWVT
ncbi:hypothetical protein ACLKA6_019938 [Drosophila palustris]